MPKFTMHAREFKKMADPLRRADGHVKYVCYLQASSIPPALRDWSRTNPRDTKMTTNVARAITSSLENNLDFHELNRGLLFSVEAVEYNTKTEMLTVELTNEDIHGNIDGGHTLRAIFDAMDRHSLSDERYVFAEFFVGLNSPVDLAVSRNTSVQVDLKSQENLNRSFETLKEILSAQPFQDRIVYKMNEHFEESFPTIDAREIIAILNMYNQLLYPIQGSQGLAGERQPVQSYTGKEASLKRFLRLDGETRDAVLRQMAPIVPDIFQLWERIELDYPDKSAANRNRYQDKKYARYSDGQAVGQTMFFRQDLHCLVPRGLIYPLAGAFRALVCLAPDGSYAWLRDPLAVWDDLGADLVQIIWNESEENPEYLGKSKNLWSNLFKEVLLYTLV